MPQWSGSTFARGIAVAILGASGGIISCAIWSAPPAHSAELTAAQAVAYRFPPNWAQSQARASAPKPAAQSTANDANRAMTSLMFDPAATYELASASASPAGLPDRANAYADPSADGARVGSGASPNGTSDAAGRGQGDKKPATVTRQTKPVSPYVFNDAQIASIKTRLRLTTDQQRYWPAVETALRGITYSKDSSRKSSKLAAVDPSSPAIQQLKSAATPLIMSFNEQQKDEVRQLARLMGLEQVAQSF